MAYFICPVCGAMLCRDEKTYSCVNNHSYDIAKSGYVNLLLSNQMNSRLPGDNKLMVKARTAFLDKNYYKPLADRLREAVREYCTNNAVILDSGCGEGYYTEKVYDCISGFSPDFYGIDISKNALAAASKRIKEVQFGVGSIFRIPMADGSCDIIMTLFAPYCKEELLRVLKNNAVMIMVIPDKKHLWGLKKIVYDNPYENEVKNTYLDSFDILEDIAVSDNIVLTSPEDIQNLFTMTPYYYKTAKEGTRRLSDLERLETEISFRILVYKKK